MYAMIAQLALVMIIMMGAADCLSTSNLRRFRVGIATHMHMHTICTNTHPKIQTPPQKKKKRNNNNNNNNTIHNLAL